MCLKLQLDHQLIKEEVHTGSFLAIDEDRKDANSIRFMQIIKGCTFANKQQVPHTEFTNCLCLIINIYYLLQTKARYIVYKELIE